MKKLSTMITATQPWAGHTGECSEWALQGYRKQSLQSFYGVESLFPGIILSHFFILSEMKIFVFSPPLQRTNHFLQVFYFSHYESHKYVLYKFENFNYLNVAFMSYKLTIWN